MSQGGLLQLLAYGSQDVYLTANPQQTFFRTVYRRHSNFVMESLERKPPLPEITEERREFLDSLMVFFFMPPKPDDKRELYRNGGPAFREWSKETYELLEKAQQEFLHDIQYDIQHDIQHDIQEDDDTD
jgi:hypothetical protein